MFTVQTFDFVAYTIVGVHPTIEGARAHMNRLINENPLAWVIIAPVVHDDDDPSAAAEMAA